MSIKAPSLLRRYLKLKAIVHSAIIIAIPLTVIICMAFSIEKNLTHAMIYAIFTYFVSLFAGIIILNSRKTKKESAQLIRFEEKYSEKPIKNIRAKLFALLSIVLSGVLLCYSLEFKEYQAFFVTTTILGLMTIFIKPYVRAFNSRNENGLKSRDKEYIFSEYTSMANQYDYLTDPAHPSSILNPTNPVNSFYPNHYL